MSSKTTESRLREALTTVAEGTSPSLEFDQVVARLDSEVGPATSHRRNRLLAAAAGLVVAATGSFAWLQVTDDDAFNLDSADTTDTTQAQQDLPDPLIPFVLPGEIVVSEDPLVVHAAQGPEPQFDTSGLGEEQAFQALSDYRIQQVLERVRRDESAQGSTHVKTVLLGAIDTIDWALNIADQAAGESWESDGASGPTDTIRCRTLRSPGSSSSQCQVANPDGLELIQPGPISDGPGSAITIQEGFIAWSRLPAEASVAVVETDSGGLWQRPRNGVTIFRAELAEGDSILFRVLDAAGAELYRGRFTALDDNPDDFFGPELNYRGPESTDERFDEATPPPSHYVLDGEVVLSEEPLIVQAAPGPEPLFDTSLLGSEIWPRELSSCTATELYDLWWERTLEDYPESVPIKFAVIGNLLGQCLFIGVSDHPKGDAPTDIGFGSAPGTNIRVRSIESFDTRLLTASASVDRDSLNLIQIQAFDDPSGHPAITGSGGLWDGFPPSTSVVVIEDGSSVYWARPHAGVVFIPMLSGIPDGTLSSVLDANGNEIFRPSDG